MSISVSVLAMLSVGSSFSKDIVSYYVNTRLNSKTFLCAVDSRQHNTLSETGFKIQNVEGIFSSPVPFKLRVTYCNLTVFQTDLLAAVCGVSTISCMLFASDSKNLPPRWFLQENEGTVFLVFDQLPNTDMRGKLQEEIFGLEAGAC